MHHFKYDSLLLNDFIGYSIFPTNNKLFTNSESDKLISYYESNTKFEFENINEVYSFKAVNLNEKFISELSQKIIIPSPEFIRVQLINNLIPSIEKMHKHTSLLLDCSQLHIEWLEYKTHIYYPMMCQHLRDLLLFHP